jgi:hypothetical protein
MRSIAAPGEVAAKRQLEHSQKDVQPAKKRLVGEDNIMRMTTLIASTLSETSIEDMSKLGVVFMVATPPPHEFRMRKDKDMCNFDSKRPVPMFVGTHRNHEGPMVYMILSKKAIYPYELFYGANAWFSETEAMRDLNHVAPWRMLISPSLTGHRRTS